MATIVPNLPPHKGPISPEAARRIERLERLSAELRELNKTEPLPDNFLDICKGRATNAVYAK
jgi:hypothetical protein